MTVAPLRDAPPATVSDLRTRLLNGAAPLADRYRALFALRNIAGPEAEAALIDGARKGEEERAGAETLSFGDMPERLVRMQGARK